MTTCGREGGETPHGLFARHEGDEDGEEDRESHQRALQEPEARAPG
jgi:hypothetical protein